MLKFFCIFIPYLIATAGCAGLKVIDPREPDNTGTLALDVSEGQPRLVATYTCKMKSMGNRFSAIGKTEEEARKEVLARCQDKTLLSFCEKEKIECFKN